ncbi:MAG: coiled-coil protein, partial [Vulcanisaeta sp.]
LRTRLRELNEELNKYQLLLAAARKSKNLVLKRQEEARIKEELRKRAEEGLQKLMRGERISLNDLLGLGLEEDSEK